MSKKLIVSDRIVKYTKARAKGLNKAQAKIEAGYGVGTKTTAIEATQGYKQVSIKDALLAEISLPEIVKIHKRNIQSEDGSVANTAIKMAYERIEPVNQVTDKEDRVVIVMK
jgi:hypothetical protein